MSEATYPIIPTNEAQREVCKCGHTREEHSLGGCNAWIEPEDEKEMGQYCTCEGTQETYEYSAEAELAWLRKQHTELLNFMNAFDECYKWCECEGGGWNEGPYWVEHPECQGHGMRVTDHRALNDLHYHAASILKTRWYHPGFHGFEEPE
jgi:hypothetical protein